MLVSAAPHSNHGHHGQAGQAGPGSDPSADPANPLSRRNQLSAGPEGPIDPITAAGETGAGQGAQHQHHHHGGHSTRGLGDYDIRRRTMDPTAGAAPPMDPSQGGHGLGHHVGHLFGLHHPHVARDLDQVLASRSHHPESGHAHSAPEEPQLGARNLDKLLALRDLIDELEARSEYEDVLFPRSFEFDDGLAVRQAQSGSGLHHFGHHHHHLHGAAAGGPAAGGASQFASVPRSFYDFEVDELD